MLQVTTARTKQEGKQLGLFIIMYISHDIIYEPSTLGFEFCFSPVAYVS